jgi:hypothetical protein
VLNYTTTYKDMYIHIPIHFVIGSPSYTKEAANWIGGWVGPTASMNTVEKRKICPCQQLNSDFSVVKHVA